MAQRAKQWLKARTWNGKKETFYINPNDGGYAGSLIGRGYIERIPIINGDDKYQVTSRGLRWIGA